MAGQHCDVAFVVCNGAGIILTRVARVRSFAFQTTPDHFVSKGVNGSPTIVQVHGAFAAASGWSGVTTRLHDRGYTVLAPASPLRGEANDSAYIASVLASISGPVVLVGHSYGGEVITNAATGNPNGKALVYMPRSELTPERPPRASHKVPGSMLTEQNLVFRPFREASTATSTKRFPRRLRRRPSGSDHYGNGCIAATRSAIDPQ